jgi:hypothetical protein
MPTLLIWGQAQALAGDPRSSKPLTDRKTLLQFHGLASEEACADLFHDSALNKLGLTGGRLRFVFDDENSELRITTAFHVSRRLTSKETHDVVEATKAQWSDGCGSGSFENFYGTVLSSALAMALLNSGESREDIGEYFVDAYPFTADDEGIRVEFLDSDDEKTDVQYLQEAAAWGEPQAQFQLARQLAEGDGVEKNEQLAVEYYQKAADQGHALALTFLGLCFQHGTGTSENLQRGLECFTTAAQDGLPLAMHCLGECYLNGQGVEANPAEGVMWYRRGMKLGDPGCTAELAECLELGNGVPQDLRQALELYEQCMEYGFDAVAPAIKRVKKKLKSGGK